MLAKLGTTTKEINSTFQPTEFLTHELDIQIKDGCSILSPVILLRDEVYDPSWNYMYLSKWGRYYFLHDAVITNGIWSVQCAVDVLASWRTGILDSTAYVRRSASDYTEHIEDSCWSHTDDPIISKTTINCGFDDTGTFILYTASDAAGDKLAVPSLSAYVMGPGKLSSICNYMFSSDFFESALADVSDGTTKGISKTFFNPFQYVVKCMWVPFTPPVDRESTINFGWWESTERASILGSHIYTHTFNFTVGSHSNWTDRHSAWANYTLYVPGFGQQTISPDFAGMTLTAEIIVDLTTGQGGLFIKNSAGAILQSATGQIGCDIQLSSLYEDIVSDFGNKGSALINGVKAGIGAISAMGGTGKFGEGLKNLGGKITSALAIGLTGYDESNAESFNAIDLSVNAGELASAAVSGAQGALQPTLSTIGANGTRAIIETEYQAVFTSTKYARYQDIHSRLGGVCNKVRSLTGLEGYTEVVNPHVNVGATSEEITMINNFLSGGFYIE